MLNIHKMNKIIFIDDDSQAFLYNNSAIVAKLKPNMIELEEKPRKIDYAPAEVLEIDTLKFNEGSYMPKSDGIYYCSYTNWKNSKYHGFYAMGDNPYGPFERKGPMTPKPRIAQDHHSIIEFEGDWYYFYHITIPEFPPNKKSQGRIACYDSLYFNKDRTIKMINHTFYQDEK